METKILVPCLFFLVLVSGQSGVHKSYDWRTTGRLQEWPKLTSLLPYERQVVTESYPIVAGPYHGDSNAYHDDSRAYPDPYSSGYHAPAPAPYQYQGDVSISTYQHPYAQPEEINMTMARIGGFAGSGDTRGFGAYDYPKNNHHVEEYEERPKLQQELTDLLKIGRNHHSGYHNPDPMLVHPMPPPL